VLVRRLARSLLVNAAVLLLGLERRKLLTLMSLKLQRGRCCHCGVEIHRAPAGLHCLL